MWRVVEPVQPTLRLVFSSFDVTGAATTPRIRRRTFAIPDEDRAPRRRHRLRRFLAATVVVCGVFALAFVVAERRSAPTELATPPDGLSALAAPAAPADVGATAPFKPPVADDAGPSAPKPGSSTVPSRSDARPSPESRRFAWAPVDGASGYHVELFRGESRVFAADTTRAEITIPAKWKFDRRVHRLDSLEYRWYVWPIVSGKRISRAVVQARLVVRDR